MGIVSEELKKVFLQQRHQTEKLHSLRFSLDTAMLELFDDSRIEQFNFLRNHRTLRFGELRRALQNFEVLPD